MLQTLFYVPKEIAGLPTFGFGWLLWLWVLFSVILLVRVGQKEGFGRETRGYVPLLLLVGALIWFLLPKVCKPQGLPIRGYGAMLLVAVVSGVGLALWRARRLGLDSEQIFTLAFWMFVPGILAARTFYVIEYWPNFQKETVGQTLGAIINVTQGGLVVYGSVIGGMLGLLAFVYKYKMPPLAILDLVTPSFLLGLAIGRFGCLLNGCCFGGPCDLPWAVTFPAGSPPHHHQVRYGQTFLHGLKIVGNLDAKPVITEVQADSPAQRQGLKAGQQIASINGKPVYTVDEAQWELIRLHQNAGQVAIRTVGSQSVARWRLAGPPRSVPVHPTQLYGMVNSLVLCLFLVAYAPFRRRDGEIWALFLTLYPITRFLMEIIRTDEPGVFGTPLSISQHVSLILLVCAAVFWVHILMKPRGTAFLAPSEPDAA